MSTLDEIRDEVARFDAGRARSLQVETGASGVFGCRAQTLLRLTGTPQSDPRVSWQALVGTAIHAMLETAAPNGVLVEFKATYRGVPCTIDRFNVDSKKLTDLKTKDDAEAIAKVERYGPTRAQIGQVMIGAAALLEAGYEVETVELLFLPRAGDLDAAWLWSSPFDRALADEAAAWSAEQDTRAQDTIARGIDPVEALEGLRDEPERFCRDYCEWVSACRGPERELPVAEDPFIIAAAEDYAAGQNLVTQGTALMKSVKPYLKGISATCGYYKVLTSGGNAKSEEVIDVDAVLAGYREWIGEPPMKTVEKVTAVSLRVTPVKKP